MISFTLKMYTLSFLNTKHVRYLENNFTRVPKRFNAIKMYKIIQLT